MSLICLLKVCESDTKNGTQHPQSAPIDIWFDFRSLEQAFKDLSGLMAKAAEMVELAERFRSTMAAQKKAAQQQGEGAQPTDPDAQQWMDSEMQAELVHMGIASPVTKAETGARYHQELARQVYGNLFSF